MTSLGPRVPQKGHLRANGASEIGGDESGRYSQAANEITAAY